MCCLMCTAVSSACLDTAPKGVTVYWMEDHGIHHYGVTFPILGPISPATPGVLTTHPLGYTLPLQSAQPHTPVPTLQHVTPKY